MVITGCAPTERLSLAATPSRRARFLHRSSAKEIPVKHEPTMRCIRCGGKGTQRGRVHVMQCPRCKGTGRMSLDDIRTGDVAGL